MKKNILYINPLHTPIEIISHVGNISEKISLEIPFLEFAENFPKKIIEIYQKHNYDEIWIIYGPWAFTQMRIVSLVINSLKFSSPYIDIRSISYFDICRPTVEVSSILEANNNEYLIKSYDKKEQFIKKSDLKTDSYSSINAQNGKFRGFIKNPEELWEKFQYFSSDFTDIATLFENIPPVAYISPLYIKPPHITWAKS